MIWSAVLTVATRWVTSSTVAFPVFFFSSLRSAESVLKSRAEKLSSKIKMGGFLTSARAIARRCFWPPDTFDPP